MNYSNFQSLSWLNKFPLNFRSVLNRKWFWRISIKSAIKWKVTRVKFCATCASLRRPLMCWNLCWRRPVERRWKKAYSYNYLIQNDFPGTEILHHVHLMPHCATDLSFGNLIHRFVISNVSDFQRMRQNGRIPQEQQDWLQIQSSREGKPLHHTPIKQPL